MAASCIASVPQSMQAGAQLGRVRTPGAAAAAVGRESALTEGPGAGATEGAARGAAIGADAGAYVGAKRPGRAAAVGAVIVEGAGAGASTGAGVSTEKADTEAGAGAYAGADMGAGAGADVTKGLQCTGVNSEGYYPSSKAFCETPLSLGALFCFH